jgi:lipoprotein-anchoring transpeptidase ErfK/SrfK
MRLKMTKTFQLLAVLGAVVAFGGCSTLTEMMESSLPERHGGRASIVVDLSEQQAYLYRGGVLVATSRISSGREGHRTPIGHFSVIRKDENHRSSVYGAYCDSDRRIIVADVDVRRTPKPRNTQFIGAPMPFFLEFSPGYGLHEGYLPGVPASHGCIRLPHYKARQFYDDSHVGTPVIVRP